MGGAKRERETRERQRMRGERKRKRKRRGVNTKETYCIPLRVTGTRLNFMSY